MPRALLLQNFWWDWLLRARIMSSACVHSGRSPGRYMLCCVWVRSCPTFKLYAGSQALSISIFWLNDHRLWLKSWPHPCWHWQLHQTLMAALQPSCCNSLQQYLSQLLFLGMGGIPSQGILQSSFWVSYGPTLIIYLMSLQSTRMQLSISVVVLSMVWSLHENTHVICCQFYFQSL